MDSTSLRIFLTVARRLSFTRAAQDVHLSQPAVSRRIHQLETELGVKLFELIGKTVSLTDAGRALAKDGERLIGDLERLRESVRSFESPQRGSLRIGASATPGFYLVPRVLGEFHRLHRDVELAYRVENTDRVIQRLIRNEIDVGFVGSAAKSAELREEMKFEDEIVSFVAASHPLASRRRPQLEMVGQETVVFREQGSSTRAQVERWLAKHRVRVTRTIELGCPEAVKAVVEAGLGISFTSRLGIEKELQSGALTTLPFPGLPLKRQLVVVRHVDKALSPTLDAFLALLREELARRKAGRAR